MQGGNGVDAVPASYGTDQGYSEDYGAPSMKPAGGTLSNDNYGAGKEHHQREKCRKSNRKGNSVLKISIVSVVHDS